MAHPVRVVRRRAEAAVRVRVAVRPRSSTARRVGHRTTSPRVDRTRSRGHRASRSARNWRRRGRRAQVSAIATTLGLLLVVSFIGNYLATVLPAQMRVNEANHALTVENQLGRLSTTLQALSRAGATGVSVVQPLSLGSAGLAPFAAPDAARVTGIPAQTGSSVRLGVYTTNYAPPNGRGPNVGNYPANCTNSSGLGAIIWNCPGGNVGVTWNFNSSICLKLPSPCSAYITTNGGATLRLNYALNNSLFEVNTTGQGKGNQTIGLFGSNDTATLNTAGGLNQTFLIIGNDDNVTINPTAGANVNVTIVGARDQVNLLSSGGSTMYHVAGWGTNLRVNPGNGGTYFVNFVGFNPQNSTGLCPQGTLSGTDLVGRFPKNSGNANGTATWLNNSPIPPGQNFSSNPPGPPVKIGWWNVSRIPLVPFPCKYFATATARAGPEVIPASLVIDLYNSYTPYAEVAMDQGAVIYAQSGAIPYMVNPPPIQYVGGQATIWTPLFLGAIPTQTGTGIATFSARQTSEQNYVFPSNGWKVNPVVALRIAYNSPYYQAWMNYFCGIPSFAATASLTLPNSSLPSGYTNPVTFSCSTYVQSGAAMRPYVPGSPSGTVTLTLRASSVILRVTDLVASVTP